ncbi:hypothetical protein D3C77_533620 [compost metagenome]
MDSVIAAISGSAYSQRSSRVVERLYSPKMTTLTPAKPTPSPTHSWRPLRSCWPLLLMDAVINGWSAQMMAAIPAGSPPRMAIYTLTR